MTVKVRLVEEPSQGRMIRDQCERFSNEIVPIMLDHFNRCQEVQLCSSIFGFRSARGFAGIADWMFFAFNNLRQNCSKAGLAPVSISALNESGRLESTRESSRVESSRVGDISTRVEILDSTRESSLKLRLSQIYSCSIGRFRFWKM